MAVSRRFKRSIGGKRSRKNLRRNTRKIGGKRSRRNYKKRGGFGNASREKARRGKTTNQLMSKQRDVQAEDLQLDRNEKKSHTENISVDLTKAQSQREKEDVIIEKFNSMADSDPKGKNKFKESWEFLEERDLLNLGDATVEAIQNMGGIEQLEHHAKEQLASTNPGSALAATLGMSGMLSPREKNMCIHNKNIVRESRRVDHLHGSGHPSHKDAKKDAKKALCNMLNDMPKCSNSIIDLATEAEQLNEQTIHRSLLQNAVNKNFNASAVGCANLEPEAPAAAASSSSMFSRMFGSGGKRRRRNTRKIGGKRRR